jgi:hypothetical protein
LSRIFSREPSVEHSIWPSSEYQCNPGVYNQQKLFHFRSRVRRTQVLRSIAHKMLPHEDTNQLSLFRLCYSHIAISIRNYLRSLLTQKYRSFGEPADCRVYRKRHGDGANTYFFSPEASEHLRIFLNFWEAFECPAPNLLVLE